MVTWMRKQGPEADRIQVHEGDGVTYLTFPALEQGWLRHAFSTRLGGVSEGPAASLNLGYGCEGDPEHVRENFRRIAGAVGFSPEQMVLSRQTHTTNVKVVTEADAGSGYTRERDYDDIDGLVTNVPGLVLVTFYADCVPLLVADPVKRAIGSAHSGWRGTVRDMGGELVRTLQQTYQSDPADLICVIGPSICQDCYEVSADVKEAFQERYPKRLHDRLWYATGQGKYQLNLWEACRQNFLLAGVPAEHIHLPDLCTCCNPQLLFSHRASQGKHGNLAAFLQIRETAL